MNNQSVVVTIFICLLIILSIVGLRWYYQVDNTSENYTIHRRNHIEIDPYDGYDDNDDDMDDIDDIDDDDTDSIDSIQQIRLSLKEVVSASPHQARSYFRNMRFPVRIRYARNIVRPSVNDIFTPDEFIYSIDTLLKRCREIYDITQGRDPWDKIVVQSVYDISVSNVSEHILSCQDGVVDKLYHVQNGKVKDISMTNISTENKKLLRDIIYDQHKKIGTVKGVVELGFFSSHPSVPIDKDPAFKFIGISIVIGGIRGTPINKVDDMISYPYVD